MEKKIKEEEVQFPEGQDDDNVWSLKLQVGRKIIHPITNGELLRDGWAQEHWEMEGTLSRLIAYNQSGLEIKTQQSYQQPLHTDLCL